MPKGEYDKWKDTNGVTWEIYDTDRTMNAQVGRDANPRYETSPGELTRNKPAMSSGSTPGEVADSNRAVFSRLRDDIEEYARGHKADVVLVVTPDNEIPWWVWVGLLWLATEL